MNYFASFKSDVVSVVRALADAGKLPAGLPLDAVTIEPPRDPKHGDVATNAAMVLAKPTGRPPRDIAQLIVPGLAALHHVESAEVAGPGFVNVRLRDSFWHAQLGAVLAAGTDYGRSDLGKGSKANVEYVSANPTGPMHVGHARGAVFGDALASLLEFAGHAVTREYYINDAGGQVDALARSLHWRYREALGEAMPPAMPEGLYPGEYMKPSAEALAARDGRKWLAEPESAWLAPLRAFAIDTMMAMIREDLELLGIRQSVFSSERGVVERGGVDEALAVLEAKGLIYRGVLEPPKGMKPDDWEPREQTLFRSTGFGDDVDRPLRKSDGSWTYFAGDAAYHLDKIRRGFDVLIDVWGADHGGHVKRMQAVVKAFSDGRVQLDCKLCQLVNLLERGQPVKMSKRAGSFVTLRDVVESVGKDVVRFIMLTRRNDVPLDFDLAKVQEQSKDNPVFYVQYAHARCRSILRKAAEEFPGLDAAPGRLAATAALDRLTDASEVELIKRVAGWPRVVEGAAEAHEPHRLAFYLHELAAAFHAHWNRGNDDAGLRFLIPGDRPLTEARLALVQGVRLVIAAGLGIIGVQPAEELH